MSNKGAKALRKSSTLQPTCIQKDEQIDRDIIMPSYIPISAVRRMSRSG